MYRKVQKNSILKKIFFLFLSFCPFIPGFSEEFQVKEPVLTVKSSVQWEKGFFLSETSMNIKAAGLTMPSARGTGVERINMELPLLVKEALFTLPVDSSNTLEDAVAQGIITLDQVAQIISDGETGASYFKDNMETLTIPHSTLLTNIGAVFIKHSTPYIQESFLDYTPTRQYTGIIIDARGTLPVHGESVNERLQPCLFPKIWDTNMNLIYERNTVEPETAKKFGLVQYTDISGSKNYENRVGRDPLRITARAIFGQNRTDILISREDAKKIYGQEENINLLKQGRVLIICDSEVLVNSSLTPKKDGLYYYAFSDIIEIFDEEEDIEVKDTAGGIRLYTYNVHFEPDTAVFLPEEERRLNLIAESLKKIIEISPDSDFLVDGHTASVGRPQDELNLSYERANAMIDEMVKRGIDRSRFAFRGFGGTKPVADNNTESGRAKNRRVEITIKLNN